MKEVFDEHYKDKYITSGKLRIKSTNSSCSQSINHIAGLIPDGKLQHLISDAATMQIIRWTKG